jgi:hypothetical protein
MSGKVIPPGKVQQFVRALTSGKRRELANKRPSSLRPELEPPPGIREVDLSRVDSNNKRS